MKSLSHEARWFLILHNLWWLGTALSNAFVGAFLWRSQAALQPVALFFLVQFLASPPAAALGGWLARRVGPVPAWRMGVAVTGVAFLATLLAGPRAAAYALPLGLLHGTGVGLYWLGFSVLSFDITGPLNRESFFGYMTALGAVVTTLGPLAAGTILGRMGPAGYSWVFGLTVALYALTAVLGGRLHIPAQGGPFHYIEMLLRRSGRIWTDLMGSHLLTGIREGLLMALPPVLFFIDTGSEAALGRFQFLVGLVAAVASYLLGLWLRPGLAWPWVAGAAALSVQPAMLLAGFAPGPLLLFGLWGAASGALFYIPWSALILNTVTAEPDGEARQTEYMAIREVYLNAGRAAPLLVFLIFPVLQTPRPLVYLMLAVSVLAVPAAWLAHRAERAVERISREPTS